MQNTSTCSLDDAQLQTRASSFVIASSSMSLAKQLMALVAIYQAQQVIKPIAVCFIMSPPPVHLSSCVDHLRWPITAPLLQANGRMSACRTRPEANPGGPQGGAQTGRSLGGAGRKLSRCGSEAKCCGGSATPLGPIFGSPERTHGDQTREN